MSENSVDMKINKDGSTSQNNFLVKRRSSDEQGPGGKFKFKDSIRERFSHEFSEAKAENATATSGYFTGSHAHPSMSSSSKVSSSHQEFYAKRRRPSRMECDESGSEVNSSTSQVCTSHTSLINGRRGAWIKVQGRHKQFSADQLTLSRPGGTHYSHPVLLAPGIFRPCGGPEVLLIVYWDCFSIRFFKLGWFFFQ